ncbi:MAG: hypothetical protein Q9178_005320 [Gyalolechia marmorata]
MTGQSILHCPVPEHPTSENDSHDLLHLYDDGRNDEVAQHSNAIDHKRDGEAGSDPQSPQDEDKTKGTDDQVIVSSIKVLHNNRLAMHQRWSTDTYDLTKYPQSPSPPYSRRHLIIMLTISSVALLVALRFLLLLTTPTSPVGAVPLDQAQSHASTSSSYWLSDIKRQGKVAYGDPNFQIFRNVKDFGAKGDGNTDDTEAINTAISTGNRCGQGCDSSTVTPALVYFPPGTYIVSKPIIQYYYTQFVGDAVSLPTIKAAPSFQGIAVIDSDPYVDGGANWYTNQNVFFRQIRNFVIDLTDMPATAGAGIHWQVAQATSLQNIRFEMVVGGENNRQLGIFMDNGSGGFMTDLVFNGGNYGAFFGNQQFTTRNITVNGANTAIYMNWNWLWTFKSLTVNNCKLGIDMAQGGNDQSVGSVLIQDSTFINTPNGINTSRTDTSTPAAGGTLIIDNVDFSGSSAAVVGTGGTTLLAGGKKVASWAQGFAYTTDIDGAANGTCTPSATPSASRKTIQGARTAPNKPASLLNSQGAVFERSKPQYETVPSSSFVSVRSAGAKGDGTTDDTAAIQAVFDQAKSDQIVYFDHGAYLITSTVKVPNKIKITGEIWPLIMASGPAFSDQSKPTPVFQVGQPGDDGAVEISDLIFETKGPAAGAILMEWNVRGQPGSVGMWDVHFRIGGTAGTDLQSNKCKKNPIATHGANKECIGAFMLLHVTEQASIYVENNWFWVADHELDLADHSQIDIYNGRGVLVESKEGPVWMYGTSSEHNVLYNYQIANAKNVYMAAIQTETPYFQANPNATTPFSTNTKYHDPDFSRCKTAACKKAWGLRVIASSDIHIFGAGLYSFFDNYSQDCLATESCQENMVSLNCGNKNTFLWGLSTKASTNQVTIDGKGVVDQKDNRNNFCSTLAVFEQL